MSWEVKKIIRDQTIYALYNSTAKNRKMFSMGAVRIKFVTPFSEPCLSCGPLVADLNHFHMHSNISYGDLFGRGGSDQGVGQGKEDWSKI